MKTATIVLSALAIGLSAFVGLFERHLPNSLEAAVQSRIVAPIDGENIKQIEITGPGGNCRLEQVDGEWNIVEPIVDRADPDAMKNFIRALERLVIRDTIEQSEINAGDGPKLEELGFGDAESIQATLTYSDKSDPLTLVFGSDAAFDGVVYLQTPEYKKRPDIYLVLTIARRFLADPVDSLRDRHLVRFHPGSVRSYSLRTASGEMELAREKHRPRWSILKPLQTRANDDLAFSIIEEITELEAASIVSGASAAAEEGEVDTAKFLLHRDGEDEPIEIVFHQQSLTSENPNGLTATVSGRDAVFQFTDDFVRRLPATANQLRYPYLADLDEESVARIQLQSPGELGADLIHDGKSWVVAMGRQAQRANSRRIEELIHALNTETILKFESDTASRLNEFGLTKPVASIEITTATVDPLEAKEYKAAVEKAEADGADISKIEEPEAVVETRKLRFGSVIGANQIYANYEGEPFIYAIDPAFLALNTPMHPINWRSLRLPSYNLFSIRGIDRVQRGDPPLKLRYDYINASWTGTKGGEEISDSIDSRRAQRLARFIGSMEVSEWLTDLSSGLEALDKPSCLLRVSIVHPDAEKMQEIQFTMKFAPATVLGNRVTSYYGQFQGHPDVFLLGADSYKQIVAPLLSE